MLKKLLFYYLILALLTSGRSYAGTGNPVSIIASPQTPDDTTAQKKDSINKAAQALTDPKDGFKDLFIPATFSKGIRIEQLNPMAINFVEDYMDKYGDDIREIKAHGKACFDMMDAVFEKEGLPKELKYLAVIESELKPNARSWAGAVGPWQFMAATARNMGLQVNRKIDERRDVYKSTHAASRYLADLFSIYGDWLLVIAAYNCGTGGVNSAIRRSGSRDFWQLQGYLPMESRLHVKKFIATHYIMEGEGGVTTLTKMEAGILLPQNDTTANTERQEVANARVQYISGRYNSGIIVKQVAFDIASFNKMNPDFDKKIALNGDYQLYLPNDKMDIFLSKKMDILRESVRLLLNPGAVSSASTQHE